MSQAAYLFYNIHPISILVFFILVCMFGFAIYYIIKNLLIFKSYNISNRDFQLLFDGNSLQSMTDVDIQASYDCPMASIFHEGIEVLRTSQFSPQLLYCKVEERMHQTIMYEISTLEAHLTVLQTLAHTAPFVGLFGTVWGVIGALGALGGGSEMYVVIISISESLFATLMGLAVAIPAQVGYSVCDNKLRNMEQDMVRFVSQFLKKYVGNNSNVYDTK